MPIQFNCPYCTATVQVPDSAAGKAGRCPKCDTKIRIPVVTASPAAPPAATAPAAPRPPGSPVPAATPVPRGRPSAPPPTPAAARPTKEQADPESFFAKFGGGASAAPEPRPVTSAAPPAAPFASPFEAPPPPKPATPVPAAPPDDEPLPFESPALPVSEGGLYFEPDPEDDFAPGSAIAQLRKKKAMSPWMIILPILGIAAIAGGVYAYLKASEPKFIGDIVGERVNLKKPITVTIPWAETQATEDDQKAIRSILDKKPLPLQTPLTVVQFLSDTRGIIIEAKNGYDTDIVRVDPHQVPIVANWLLRNGDKLQISRSTTVAPAAREFAARISSLIQNQTKITSSEFAEFRDRLALPALNRTLGHWCGAVVDNQIYPCVYEDPQGLLYFAVPTSARFFQVREKGTGPEKMLPPTFLINVTLPPRAALDSVVSEPEAKDQGKMEPESEKMPDESMPEKTPEPSTPEK